MSRFWIPALAEKNIEIFFEFLPKIHFPGGRKINEKNPLQIFSRNSKKQGCKKKTIFPWKLHYFYCLLGAIVKELSVNFLKMWLTYIVGFPEEVDIKEPDFLEENLVLFYGLTCNTSINHLGGSRNFFVQNSHIKWSKSATFFSVPNGNFMGLHWPFAGNAEKYDNLIFWGKFE